MSSSSLALRLRGQRPLLLSGLLLAGMLLSGSAHAQVDPSDPIADDEDDGDHGDHGDDATQQPMELVGDDEVLRYPPTSVRLPLIVGGIVTIGIPYGIGALSGSAWPEVPGSDALYVPIAGPWIALGQSGCASDDPDCGAILAFRGIMYVISGVVQLGGLALIGEGVFMTTEADAPEEPKASWSVTPFVTPQANGIGIAGTF